MGRDRFRAGGDASWAGGEEGKKREETSWVKSEIRDCEGKCPMGESKIREAEDDG